MWTALVPARGGSKGVRGKNLRPVNGRPLILHTLDMLARVPKLKVIVSTDSHQIESTVLSHYPDTQILSRLPHLADDDATIDQLVEYHRGLQPFLLVQPTAFGLDPNVVLSLINWATSHPGYWVATQPVSGIYWLEGEMVDDERTNRQSSWSRLRKEIGLRAINGEGNMMAWTTRDHIIEIDSLGDFTEAERDRRDVVICFSAQKGQGWGHLHRSLALYEALQHHRVTLTCTEETTTAATEYVESLGITMKSWGSDLMGDGVVWVNDTLDTTEGYVANLISNGCKVVSLEDQGPGARLAHKVVNALYGDGDYNGVRYSVLRPEFLDLPPYEVQVRPGERVRVLVSFGGEDDKDLGGQVARLLGDYDVMLLQAPATLDDGNPGASVAYQMQRADLLITSAGRTVYEAMAVGVPTIVLAANLREARHQHLGPEFGNIYLGLAETVLSDAVTLPRAVAKVLASVALRQEMSTRGRSMIDGKGVARMVRIVEDML